MKSTWSKEARRKLSESMKRTWVIRRQKEAKARLAEFIPVGRADNGAKPSLTSLFSAAVTLSTDDGEKLKQAICDCAKGETIVAALEAEQSEGNNLHNRMRKQLTSFIQAAL
jgi:hypothetical protein